MDINLNVSLSNSVYDFCKGNIIYVNVSMHINNENYVKFSGV